MYPYQISNVETMPPKMMVLRGKNLGSCLSHEDGALMNGISALSKEPQSFLDFSTLARRAGGGLGGCSRNDEKTGRGRMGR